MITRFNIVFVGKAVLQENRSKKDLFVLTFFGIVLWLSVLGFIHNQGMLPPTEYIVNKTAILFEISPQIKFKVETSQDHLEEIKKPQPVPGKKMTKENLIGPELKPLKNMKQCRHLCGNKSIFLLNVVHSPIGNIKQRMMIRESWGEVTTFKKYTIQTVFILGREKHSLSTIQDDIENEIADFGDIVQGGFLDTEENHLLQHFLGLQWVSTNCMSAKYVLTTEDNVLINVPNLMNYLTKNKEQNILHCVYTYSSIEIPIHTVNGNRIYTINYGKSDQVYPPFCMRMVYITSASSIRELYHAAIRKSDSLLFDDVYITGILANETKLQHTEVTKQYRWELWNEAHTMKNIKDLIFIQMPHFWRFQRTKPLWCQAWAEIKKSLPLDITK